MRRRDLLLAVGLLALVVRLISVAEIARSPIADLRLGDAKAYHDSALRIAGGDWVGEGVFYQAPLYPYFLAPIYTVFGSGTPMVRFVQAIIGAGSCVLTGAAAIALFGSTGIIAGALLAIYPPAIFMDGLLDKSALVTFLMAALLFLLADTRARPRALLAGIVLGLLSLTRENALLLALPAVAWLLASHRRLQTGALFFAGCAIVLLPVAVRNLRVGGEFHLTTSQFGPNLYIGNHSGSRGIYEPLVPGHGSAADERDDAVRLAERAAGRALSPSEVSSYWTGEALAFIHDRPGEWMALLARKFALTFNATEIADTESQEVYAEWSAVLRVLAPFSFGVLLALAALGACITAPSWRQLWFLHAIAITYTLSVIAFCVYARYRFPLVPILAMLAAGGAAMWNDPASRRLRGWSGAALVVAAAAAYVPLEDTRTDRLTHYVNIANAFLPDPTKRDQAATFYDKALNESPQSPAAHFGLGTLLLQKDLPRESLEHFRIAVAGWPANADVRFNYAVALELTGDTKGAAEQREAAERLAR